MSAILAQYSSGRELDASEQERIWCSHFSAIQLFALPDGPDEVCVHTEMIFMVVAVSQVIWL